MNNSSATCINERNSVLHYNVHVKRYTVKCERQLYILSYLIQNVHPLYILLILIFHILVLCLIKVTSISDHL